MVKEHGTGRTRLGRFAAITVPAAAATGALGFAMLNGMVGAVLSSADGFTLDTGDLTTSGIKMTANSADVAGGDQAAIYAETQGSHATDHLNLTTASIHIPIVDSITGPVHLAISSTLTDPVDLGNVALSAQSINTACGASLGDVTVGQAVSEAAFTNDAGLDQNGFALAANSGGTLRNVSAHSFAVTLSTLDVGNLSIDLVKAPYDPASYTPPAVTC